MSNKGSELRRYGGVGLTVEEFAQHVGMSKSWVTNHIAQIPHIKLGRRYLIRHEAIEPARLEGIVLGIADEIEQRSKERRIEQARQVLANADTSPRPDPVKEKVPEPRSEYEPGDKVYHDKFGLGHIAAVTPTSGGRDFELKVKFVTFEQPRRLLESIVRGAGNMRKVPPSTRPHDLIVSPPSNQAPTQMPLAMPPYHPPLQPGDAVVHKVGGMARVLRVWENADGTYDAFLDFGMGKKKRLPIDERVKKVELADAAPVLRADDV